MPNTVVVKACTMCETKPSYGSDEMCANCRRNYNRIVAGGDWAEWELQIEKTERKLRMLNNLKKAKDTVRTNGAE